MAATVIDELIVSLGLDPSGFDAGQRKAAESLRGMERGADQSTSKIEGLVNQRLKTLFENIAKAYADTAKQLGNTGEEARKTGDTASRSINNATTSVRGLVAAGLAAYAAFTAVKGVVDEVAKTLGNAERQYFNAQFAGVPSQWLRGFANAANRQTGIPQATTESWLTNLRSQIVGYSTPGAPGYGQPNQTIRSLNMIGIDWLHASEQQLVAGIADYLKQLPADRARAASQGFGIPEGLVPFLQQGGAGIRRQQQLFGTTVTNDEIEKAHQLMESFRGIQNAWDDLVTKVEANLEPLFGPMLKDFETWLRDLGQTEDGLKKATLAVGVLAVAIGVTLIGAVEKLAATLIATNAAFVKSPLGRALLIAWGAYELIKEAGPGGVQTQEGETPNQTQERLRTTRNPELDKPSLLRRAWNWITGNKEEATAASPPKGGPVGANPSAGKITAERIEQAGVNPKTAAALALITHWEDPGGENIMNYEGKARGVRPDQPFGYTAQGWWQMLNSNWRKYAGQLGYYPQYTNAMAAPFDIQARVAARMFEKEGPGPWATGAGGSINTARLAAIQRAMAAAGSGSGGVIPSAQASEPTPTTVHGDGWPILPNVPHVQGFPPDTKFSKSGPNAGRAYSKSLATMSDQEKRNVEASMQAIRAAQSKHQSWARTDRPELANLEANGLKVLESAKAKEATAAIPPPSHVHNDNDVNIGDVHVHTQATDAHGIAKHLTSAIRQQLLTSHANTGLDY